MCQRGALPERVPTVSELDRKRKLHAKYIQESPPFSSFQQAWNVDTSHADALLHYSQAQNGIHAIPEADQINGPLEDVFPFALQVTGSEGGEGIEYPDVHIAASSGRLTAIRGAEEPDSVKVKAFSPPLLMGP